MPASFDAQLRDERAAATLPSASGSQGGTNVTPVSAAPGQGSAQFAMPGPAGPTGPTGGAPQVFEFDTASSEWTCVHGLGRLPVVLVYDLAGNLRPLVSVSNPDPNTTIVSPTPPLAGKVLIS